MITAFFIVGLLWMVWKVLVLGIKMAWGIFALILGVVLLPIVLIVLFVLGLVYLAFPLILIIGVGSLLFRGRG